MRNNFHLRHSQQGTGLIEVLVSILVLSVGLLAISKLHGMLIRDGGTANNHAIAVSLAQEKLDDLRGFRYISTTTSNNLGCGQGIFCYDEIASAPILPATTSISSNAGGHEGGANGALTLPSGSVTVGNTTFTRNWQAVRQNGFTVVTATVTWTDQNGVGTESLTTSIMADDANITAMAANGAGGGSQPGPKVAYQPKGVPDVVPITISTGTSRETSQPLPDVSSKGLSVSSQFSSVNYDADGEQIQEDFVTLNCSCQFAASASANPASYFTYDKGSLVVKYPKTSDEKVSKITGVAITSQGDSQDPLCNTCCADHHDKKTDTTTALFDPERPREDYANGNHRHYYYSDANNPNLGLNVVSETAGNNYLEACRFLRVDGIYRIMQDWRLSDVAVMPKEGYLVEGSTALTEYKNYVESVVKGQAKTDVEVTVTVTPWDKSGLSITRNLTERSAGPIQLLARGIYVDKVYSGPRTPDRIYYSGIVASPPTIGLDKIPFNEVNVTLLASWASSNTGVVTVTNEEIKDITSATSNYYGVYSRGRANVVSGNGGSATVTAYVLPSNSGLTGGATRATYASTVDYDDTALANSVTIGYDSEIGIDRHDHASALRKSDAINIARTGSGSTGSRRVTGILQLGNSSGDLSKVSVSSPCTVSSAIGNSTTFSCSFSDPFERDLTLGTSQTGGSLSRTTCHIPPGTTDVNCESYSVYGPTIQIRGTCDGNRCDSKDLVITASGTGATCTKDKNNPYCTVPLDNTGEWSGTITLSGVQKMDIKSSTTGASCTTNGTKSILFSTQGRADQPSAFNMCATN